MQETSYASSLSDSILRTLLYYDIFSYPLTAGEVFKFLPTNGVTSTDVAGELETMVDQSLIFKVGSFFSVHDDVSLSVRREKGNALAAHLMDKARKRARLISRFPFVRGVMVSGSLSKGFMDEKSDIDFFIITVAGRLWISRMMLVLFKKIFLRNSHKHFCINYFIDSSHLEIEEKNLFTATELATLIPMVNAGLYIDLLSSNRWLKSFFPNYIARETQTVSPAKGFGSQRFIERVINLLFGKKLERFCKNATHNYWKRLYEKKYSASDFNIAFKTTDHASKGHPQNYQRHVIEQYQHKLDCFASAKALTSRG